MEASVSIPHLESALSFHKVAVRWRRQAVWPGVSVRSERLAAGDVSVEAQIPLFDERAAQTSNCVGEREAGAILVCVVYVSGRRRRHFMNESA